MASEASLRASVLIQSTSIQPDNFLTECKYMLGRVFLPSQTPIRVEAHIFSNIGGIGFIGTDRYMKYTSRLTTPEGKQIPLQERDLHITLSENLIQTPWVLRIVEFVLKKIFFFLQHKKEIEKPGVLPSSILSEAKENDILRFRWDGCLFEYRLKQHNHSVPEGRENFESNFQSLQLLWDQRDKSVRPYLFEEDFPPLYSFELNKLFSEKAQIYSLVNKTLSPLTADQLKLLEKPLSQAQRFNYTLYANQDSSFTLVFDAPGVSEKNFSERLLLFLDHRYLLILIQAKDEWAPKETVTGHSKPEWTYCALELEDIDPSTINLVFLYGVGRMTYRAKSSPQTASPIES